MSLKRIFSSISSKKAAGVAMVVGGGALAVIDAFRLASGDVSVLGGTSAFAAFATHAGMVGTGMSLLPKEEPAYKTVIVRGFRPSNNL